ncbi:Histone-lysine N-methyltransferase 2C [Chionoecetes opilio]|uniref:Histone-lysine N-methyltransferase 2C n=1 Tax=Chionoecetes opilio TaxID=41210 RepID=A0A8J5C209_CHIOP|nr:Histone-lysine N-methyltransferase 2C [Chionoecetes opilio]
MEKPHGVSFEDGSPDTKWEKGTPSGRELSSCGSTSGPASSSSTSVGGRIEEKMDIDDPLLLPSLASLPSSSSITITKATVAQQRPSHSPSTSSTPSSTPTHVTGSLPSMSRTPPSTSSSDSISSVNRALLGPDMMPTIPLVPVQVPCGRGSIVTLPKVRGRPKGMPLSPSRAGNIHVRRGMKIRRIGLRGRGGRRLSHSMSLEERGGGLIGEDSPLPLDDEAYVQDDMFMAATYPDRWSGRVCSLCCLGEQSQLGQGDLVRHDPTPGYVLPEKIASPSESSSQESLLLSRKLKATQASLKEKGKSPRKQVGELLPDPVSEISLVGHSDLPNIPQLFESSGHCYVHYMCALWSSSVELTNDDTITHVDRAVVGGASQRCAQCKKFGATLQCKAPGCPMHYHFPCAMGAGALMDLKSVALVCPAHTDKSRDIVDVACTVCENLSPESSLLFCCSCGNHYHGLCLKPVISPIPVMRAGWQCPDCKTCQVSDVITAPAMWWSRGACVHITPAGSDVTVTYCESDDKTHVDYVQQKREV